MFSTRSFRFHALILGLLFTVPAAANPFPLPSELEPDVAFWVSIFAEVSSDEGVLHDSVDLGIVYERFSAPANAGRRATNRNVGDRRKKIAAALNTLASGKRDNLTSVQRDVLSRWPDDVDNATLKAAASRIRFQRGLSDRFREGLERSGRWRTFVEQQMTARGVPADLVALPHVESSYNVNARSHVGASGIWQFTRSTGRRFMRVDHVMDERNDPYAATEAAARLLAYNYSITGNWPMAITAYNHGLSGVRRAMRQFGDDALVQILREYKGRTFGFASRNFYVAFLAARQVDQNPDKYFEGLTYESPTDYSEATLKNYLSVDALARATGVSRGELATHNPSWQPTIWQGSKHVPKGTLLRLPRTELAEPLDAIFAALGPDEWANEQLPDMFHRIQRGETLSEIAETYKTRVSTLVALNNLRSSNSIRAGQRLRLPAAGPSPVAATTQAESTTQAAVEVAVVAAESEDATPIVEQEPAALGGDGAEVASVSTGLLSDPSDYSVADNGTIEIHPEETLGHYADWLGLRTQRLRDLNGLAFRTPVEVGRRLRLDFSRITKDVFEDRRVAYHRQLQDAFFREHRIADLTQHTIRRGESIWILSLREYAVPVWLFRQYNPGLDLHRVRPGTVVQIPILAESAD